MNKKIITFWMALVAILIASQILLGGYVRLTGSGLSMYDWHVVKGIIPPLSEESWQETFQNYQQTPEYKKINVGMSLEDYKEIYLREYNHRILGRINGLVFVIPLFIFLFTGKFKWRESKVYLTIGLLYAFQGVWGWYMVQSGLVDRPHVSHFRLAIHFVLAFVILALVLWKLFDTLKDEAFLTGKLLQNSGIKFLLLFFVFFLIQITYGAFVAGLKAGHVSDTFPLMFGYLIPPNLWDIAIPGIWNLFENSVTVHFIHRWFAFIVFGFALISGHKIKKQTGTFIASLLPLAIFLQITLGLMVIWMHVPISIALMHQSGAVIILVIAVFLLHKSTVKLQPGN